MFYTLYFGFSHLSPVTENTDEEIDPEMLARWNAARDDHSFNFTVLSKYHRTDDWLVSWFYKVS